ncbi:MAG TPA: glycosyltransferase family 4 protein, partial [Candidatus Krumholzibacteriaceae bacterium]
LIRNGITVPSDEPAPADESEAPLGAGARRSPVDDRWFLWVGRFQPTKRPDLFLDLARALPEVRFTMIGGYAGDEKYAVRVTEAAARLANVTHIPFVPPAEIEPYYRRARALINTSSLEGFPNTYLHAWVYGVPVITLEIDPDEIVSKNRIGIVAGTFEGLVEAVRSLRVDESMRSEMSARAFRYVRENHDIKDRGDDYIRFFENVLSTSR